ncbi:hypothetical protein [Sulfurimonas indica]|uniref:hypothetical protein n=1 Tax=Sulfurimonas TaxID=202746 RepID=UPI0012656FFF|nr:hypothetical protein [Sulfurimonas indica]
MAKIDRLREEAIELRTRMFFVLGLIAVFFGGFGSLYIKLVEKSSGMIIAGMFVLLILIPFLAIIYYKIRVSYFEKLNELELEKG